MADTHPSKIDPTTVAPNAPTPGEQPATSVEALKKNDSEAWKALDRVDPRTVQEPARKTSAKRAKPAALESCADLLRAVYSGKRKRLKPPEKVLGKIRQGPKLQPAEREELLSFAVQDHTLERTRELMLLSVEHFDGPNLAGQVREFVRDVLMRHPAFRKESLAAALRNLPEGPAPERAVKILTQQSFESLPWPEGSTPLEKSVLDKCRTNAAYCLLLWHREIRGISFKDIINSLHTSLWKPAAERHKSEAQQLRALMNNRDPTAAALSCSSLEEQVLDAERRADAAREITAGANARARELEGKLGDLEGQLAAEKTQVERLTAALHTEQQAHKNDVAHSRDEYAKLRGHLLRRIRQELSLLEDGLHALRRTPPKVRVMDDHAERAIDGLKREIQRLEGSD